MLNKLKAMTSVEGLECDDWRILKKKSSCLSPSLDELSLPADTPSTFIIYGLLKDTKFLKNVVVRLGN